MSIEKGKAIAISGIEFQDLDEISELYSIFSRYGVKIKAECRHGGCKAFLIVPKKLEAIVASAPIIKVSSRGNPLNRGKRQVVLNMLPPAPIGRETAIARQFAILSRQTKLIDSNNVVLGYSVEGVPLNVPLRVVWRHIGIFGTTGSGKTHTSAFIISNSSILNTCSVIILDWHNEYSSILEEIGLSFYEYKLATLPPMDVCPSSVEEVEKISEILQKTLDLNMFQLNILRLLLIIWLGDLYSTKLRYLLELFNISMRDINEIKGEDLLITLIKLWRRVEESGNIKSYSKSEREVWLALLRRLESIFLSPYSHLFACRNHDEDKSINSILSKKGIHVLRIGEIIDTSIRRLYTAFTLFSIFTNISHMNGENCVLVVVEEAGNLVASPGIKRILEEIISEARKYRLGIILISNSLNDIYRSRIMSNINTLIIHRLNSLADIQALSNILREEYLKNSVQMFEPGEALIYTTETEKPLMVKIPLLREEGI